MLVALPAPAQTDRSAETQIKATFLYKFAGFIEWPAGAFAAPDSPIEIGVLGADALAGELENIVSGRTVHGRPLAIRRLKRGEPTAGLHALFVGHAESGHIEEVLNKAKGQALLVVTESEDAQPRGSVINFVTVDDKVRFDIAPPPASPGNIRISARLLGVARKVIPG
jgi:hypothetical protein